MGLGIEVGILADLLEHDPGGAEQFQEYFSAVNLLLHESELPLHHEPTEASVWSAQMFGYGGLHYLRRLAAHLDLTGELPAPGDDDSADDKVLEGYFEDYNRSTLASVDRGSGIWGSTIRFLTAQPKRYRQSFNHLIVHSDAEGFYLPQTFDEVLLGDDNSVPGGMVGSAPRLLKELEELAEALQIPDELSGQPDLLWAATQSQGQGDQLWDRYAVESLTCVVLREGCRQSIAQESALVFC